MRPVRTMMTAAVALAVMGIATNASGATVSLTINAAQSSVTSLPIASGGRGYLAPYSSFRFEATVTNDMGQTPLPNGGSYATVDLIARTPEGDKVVSQRTIFDATPLSFSIQTLNQTTLYYARVNAAPANGIAAATNSSGVRLRAFLRNYPNVFRSSYTRKITFSGFYSKPVDVSVRRSVRTLIQRRVGKKWMTLAKLTPNSSRSWKAVVSQGTLPAVFRVRTVPIAPVRFLPVTEYRYCVAGTLAGARKACRSVALGLNELGLPGRVVAVAAND